MKWLLDMFENLRPHFEDNGKLGFARPVFSAAEFFFFSPSTTTSCFPHIRDSVDVKRFMATVIVALLPTAATALYFFGLRFLAMLVVSYAVGGAVEVAFAIVRKEELNEGFLVTGFIFPLVLPPALPLWMVGVGIGFGVIIGKELFGGTGRNLFNPALVGRCFLALGYPVAMTAEWVFPGSGLTGRMFEYVGTSQIDAITSATPLISARQGDFAVISDLLLGSVAGSIGETSAIAVIAGGLFLLVTKVANWRTVVSLLGSFLFFATVLHYIKPDVFGPPIWHLFAGGLLFGTFFMATDPVTCPVSNPGKVMYGVVIGLVTVLIRNISGFVEGVMFAILLGNIAAPVFDEMAIRIKLWRLADEG